MTNVDPVLVYLEVPHAAGPRAILGLGNGPVDRATIEAAMTMRLKMIDRHPLAAETAADKAREVVRAAAAAVLAKPGGIPASPRPPVPPSRIRVKPKQTKAVAPVAPKPSITAAHLTPFDRLVLAVLLAGGGWNSRTRSILTGLATQVGLDSENLQRVVLGLAKFVRERGSQGTVDSAAELPMAPPVMRTPGRIEGAMSRLGEGLGREVRGETAGSLLRMVTIFVLIAVVMGVLLVRVLTTPSKEERSLEARREAATAKVAQDMKEERDEVVDSVRSDHEVVPSTRTGVVLPAKYDRPPNFRSTRRPEAAMIRLDATEPFFDVFADLARQLELRPRRLAEQKYSGWVEAVDAGATTWPLMNPTGRERYREGLFSVLKQASSQATADRLVDAFKVDPMAPIIDPLESWIRPFHGGMLAAASARLDLPPEVRSAAMRTLEEAFGSTSIGQNIRRGPFFAGAGRTLDDMTPALVKVTGLDADALDAWELWLVAQEVVRSGSNLELAHVLAIETLLQSGRNLAVEGDPVNVLGRLLEEIDWGPTGPDPMSLRERFAEWLSSPEISSNAIWVLTSLLDQSRRASWYRPDFVVPAEEEGGMESRRRILGDVLAAWPEPIGPVARGNQVLVNSGLLLGLDEMLVDARARVNAATTDYEQMQLLLLSARLAEAAALLVVEREEEAVGVLALVNDQLTSGKLGVDDSPILVGQVGGVPDGDWAARFESIKRDQQQRIDMLQSLRSRSALASDLGPRDAQVFSEQIWRAASSRERSVARAVLLENYVNGPVLAMELLNTMDRASTNDDTLEFVEAYTGELMPTARADDALQRMRMALARKALGLLDTDRERIERVALAVEAAAVNRLETMAPGTTLPATAGPAEVAGVSADAMRAAAEVRLFADPFPGTLDELDRTRAGRRWLAGTSPQQLVAELAAETDFLAYVVAADVPSVRQDVARILEQANIDRARASTALRQAIVTELGIVELERLRMAPRDRDPLGGAS
ncbi:MAG: hypothetical protein MK085_04980 [Phycisphaerales bacterium]|nr:hypothetical protein [Phycisphaerales bacterium]